MALVKTDDPNYKNIAAKIRENLAGSGDESNTYFPEEMAEGVQAVADYNLVLGYQAGVGESEPGNDGLTPFIGENGNWWIGEEDTGVQAEGKDGKDGITPHIGENGTWWFGEEDTGVLARGKNGYTPVKGTDYFTPSEQQAIIDEARCGVVPRMPLIDKEVENDSAYKFAYDFAGKYDRVYVEQSGGGWNGNGGNVYNKYVISSDGSPVWDPDFKDYKVDENGEPCGGKLNSIMMRMAHGYGRVPPHKRAELEALKKEYGYNDYEVSKFTAPISYVDETLELAKEYADNGLSSAASSATKTQTGALLVLDDINPLSKRALVSGDGGTVLYVGGANLAYKDTVTANGSTAWQSATITVYPPKNKKYILSCDFENVTGLTVGIAVKPDNSSTGWWKELTSTEASGSLSLEVQGGDYTKNVALKFYSNSTANAVESECIFSNIVFRLADIDVPAGTKGCGQTKYTVDAEADSITVDVPDVDTVLVYTLEGEDVSVIYGVDTNRAIEDTANKLKKDIPTLLSQLEQDAQNRTVTDKEKKTWNDKVSLPSAPTSVDSSFVFTRGWYYGEIVYGSFFISIGMFYFDCHLIDVGCTVNSAWGAMRLEIKDDGSWSLELNGKTTDALSLRLALLK